MAEEPTINEMSDDDIKNLLSNVCGEYETNRDYLQELSTPQLLNVHFGIQYLNSEEPVAYKQLSDANENLAFVRKSAESELQRRVGIMPIQYNDNF